MELVPRVFGTYIIVYILHICHFDSIHINLTYYTTQHWYSYFRLGTVVHNTVQFAC